MPKSSVTKRTDKMIVNRGEQLPLFCLSVGKYLNNIILKTLLLTG